MKMKVKQLSIINQEAGACLLSRSCSPARIRLADTFPTFAAAFLLGAVGPVLGEDFPCDPVLSSGGAIGLTNPAQFTRELGVRDLVNRKTTKDALNIEAAKDFLELGGHGAGRLPGDSLVDRRPHQGLPRIPDARTKPAVQFLQSQSVALRPVVLIEKPKHVFDEKTKTSLGNLFRNNQEPTRQADPLIAVEEARQRGPVRFSPSEVARQDNSSKCSVAYRNLVTQFEANRLTMEFWTDKERTVADFVFWYYQADLPEANRSKAAPVVQAQEQFEKGCMEGQIPPELSPPLVQRAVGLLMFDDKVFCTALRLSNNELLTAKHCFVDPRSGLISGDVNAVSANLGRMWFAYEAEPNHRFGVCKGSLPKSTNSFAPSLDNVRIRISNTNTPPAPIKWAQTPLKPGTSLYLRGYFPFVEGATNELGRLRSSSAGGCFAHSGAGRCFFHACQTTPIMSGAPIFTRPEPNAVPVVLEVAGLHIGSAMLSDPNNPNGSICTGIDGTKVPSSNFAYQP